MLAKVVAPCQHNGVESSSFSLPSTVDSSFDDSPHPVPLGFGLDTSDLCDSFAGESLTNETSILGHAGTAFDKDGDPFDCECGHDHGYAVSESLVSTSVSLCYSHHLDSSAYNANPSELLDDETMPNIIVYPNFVKEAMLYAAIAAVNMAEKTFLGNPFF